MITIGVTVYVIGATADIETITLSVALFIPSVQTIVIVIGPPIVG